MQLKHTLIKSPLATPEALIAFSITPERAHSFYKDLNKDTQAIGYEGNLLLDLKACNENEDERFFSVPVVHGQINWAKLVKADVAPETRAFCNTFIQSINYRKFRETL
jgi:hypothetical protein